MTSFVRIYKMLSIFNKYLIVLIVIGIWVNDINGLSKGKFKTKESRKQKRKQTIEFFEKEKDFVSNSQASVSQRAGQFNLILQTDSGPTPLQKIRNRGDGKINKNDGRIELFDKNKNKWVPVCDGYWGMNVADAACRSLGYVGGAREANTGDRYGKFLGPTKTTYASVHCYTVSKTLDDCERMFGMCSGKSAGVSCKLNPGCPLGWTAFKGACFRLEESRMTFKEANQFCQNQNSQLVYPLTVEENNFLTNMLKTENKDILKVWTSGYYTEVEMDDGNVEKLWKFKSTIHTLDKWNLGKLWFPGFSGSSKPVVPSSPRNKSCIAMSSLYTDSSTKAQYDVDYFWWENLSCNELLPFICQKNIKMTGRTTGTDCYNGNGEDYRGSASRTNQGSVCSKWSDPQSYINANTNPFAGLGDHNYCRNPDNDDRPWCWVNPVEGLYGYCDLMKCSDLPPPPPVTTPAPVQAAGFGLGGCSNHEYHCPSMISIGRQCVDRTKLCDKTQDCFGNEDEDLGFCEKYVCNSVDFFCKIDLTCISRHLVCDGIPHCSDKSDEKNCSMNDEKKLLLANFDKIPSVIPKANYFMQHAGGSVEQCMQLCILWHPTYNCKSFAFVRANLTHLSTCFLFHDLNTLGDLSPMKNWESGGYYYLKSACANNGDFQCKWGLCIPAAQKCNQRNDCGDHSDEDNCDQSQVIPFDIRLVGSDNLYEGLVHVRYNGEWGYVCDEKFDKKDADVICRMLGYEKLAKQAIPMAAHNYQVKQPINILVSQLNCTGAELALPSCKHAPWRQTSCAPDQLAGVVCNANRPCSDQEFRCNSSGNCIELSKVCDGASDCPDMSDEPQGKCDLKVSLVGSSSSKGRLELSKGYSKGTVCDDGFTVNDAKVACRMLGFTGKAAILEKGKYSVADRGLVAVTNMNCLGIESSLEQCSGFKFGSGFGCQHSEDIGIDCAASEATDTIAPNPSPNVNSCGNRPIMQMTNRIVKGKDAMYGAFPWQARISLLNNKVYCGGIIISDRYILTAAHCFKLPIGQLLSKDLFKVVVGDGNINSVEVSEQEFEIDELILYPNYNHTHFNNDLAIIKIKSSSDDGRYIQFSSHVQAVCLPQLNSEADPNTKCLISGWGSVQFQLRTYPVQLQFAMVPLIDKTMCDYLYASYPYTDAMICAGFQEGGIDSCQGDSGGPLVCLSKGKYKVFGITSWGIGCGQPQKPGVYTNVKKFLPFIKQITGIGY